MARSARIDKSWLRIFGGVLLSLHIWVELSLIQNMSVTYNEASHITAGLACWYAEDYDLYNVNPPLPRMLATSLLLDRADISLAFIHRIQKDSAVRQENVLGRLFADTNALGFHHLVCRARLAGLFWITLGGVIVWRWSHRLFGASAGLFALTLWTFEPTLSAHGALVTADMPATAATIAAAYCLWIFTCSKRIRDGVIAGIVLGIALLTKFTVLLLAPLFAVICAHHALSALRDAQSEIRDVHRASYLFGCALLCIVALIVVNAGYGFQNVCSPIRSFSPQSSLFSKCFTFIPQRGVVESLPCPLPSAYLNGLDVQQRDFEQGLYSYLNGCRRQNGWWYYYLVAFSVKSPLGHLIILVVSLGTIIYKRMSIPSLLWATPLVIFTAASCKTGYTNHLRYILPAYPFYCVLAGVLFAEQNQRLRRCALVAGLLGVSISIASCCYHYPNWLGYFNETVGGPQNGWKYLADSNVDWGQDWLELKRWLDRNSRTTAIHVALAGVVDPAIYLEARYPLPHAGMGGIAIVDAHNLMLDYSWLMDQQLVSRIGTSIFVFKVNP
ncbi:MAG TPA: glycosyltransferase family 39 protein [Pirellulales bacterium]|jgi:4-amino-4-deoxy-L-arabinose transferase-like glycosyltransferase